jgi:hypothetical protein
MPNQTTGAPSIPAFRGCAGRPALSQRSTTRRTEIGTACVTRSCGDEKASRGCCATACPEGVAVSTTNVGRLSVAHGRTLRRLPGKLLEVPIPRGH